MRESETQMLVEIFGGQELLLRALGIGEYATDEQEAILGRFCEYVFKRVLLNVPGDQMGGVIDAFESHRASGRSLNYLIDELRIFVPGMDQYVQEELVRSVKEYSTVDTQS